MDIEKVNGALLKVVLVFTASAVGLFGVFSLKFLI